MNGPEHYLQGEQSLIRLQHTPMEDPAALVEATIALAHFTAAQAAATVGASLIATGRPLPGGVGEGDMWLGVLS
jgi:hypothetical protein